MATVMSPRDRPAPARSPRGKWPALILAICVNLLFVGVLVFSVSWRNRTPEAVTAELYAPPPPVVQTPRPVVKPQPVPQPPPPPPKPVPKPPEAAVPKPDAQADIALKAKQEAERQRQEQADREARRQEELRRQDEARKQEEARKDAARQAEEKRQADLRQQRQLEQMRAQAAKEAQMRTQAERELQMRAQAERESQMRAEADSEARARAQQAASAARNRAQLDWIDKIRSRIRGNINLPPDIPGNPEAVFDIVQLPTGEIIDVKLRKSSGVRAYDDAVQRAILKSSPLPKPVPADLFQRSLELRFRPLDQ